MKIGDKVFNLVGDRVYGSFGSGEIVKFTNWAGYPAATVKSSDGLLHRNCLCKNLVLKSVWIEVEKWRDER